MLIKMEASCLLHFRVALIALFACLVAGSCEDQAVGIENKLIIPDEQLTSSSNFNASTPAKTARLNFVGLPWCAAESGSSPLYLQVDLISLHAVCAVATQGNSKEDQWVERYQLQTSTDRTTWTNYTEGGEIRDFQGSTDRNTTIKQILFESVVARFVRVVPIAWYGSCCLRVELYGVNDACQTTAVGIADRAKIPDHRMTATTYYNEDHRPYKGRLSVTNCAWGAKKSFTRNDYLQVDLGGSYFICALATKGSGCNVKEWTKKYKIYLSLDNKSWNTYNEGGAVKIFTGNTDSTTIKTNKVSSIPRAKFIRFWATEVNQWTIFRVEVYGAAQGCRSPLGMEDNSITDSQITAQPNTNTAHNGRLYNTLTWCSSNSNAGYIEVDLGRVKTVTGVASQGRHSSDKWVKTYHISYKYGSSPWQDYKLKQDSESTKTFDGNENKNGVRVNWFPVPVVARYIRVVADSWTPLASGPCLRIDLYGCDYVLRPRISLKRQRLAPTKGSFVDVVCKVTSQPYPVIQWWHNNTDVTSLSTGVIHSDDSVNSVSVSTLRVNYTSADNVASAYDCVRKSQSSHAVTCTAYSCVTFYAGNKAETEVTRSAAVFVTLYVPAAPSSVIVHTITGRTAILQWNTTLDAPDDGSILSYIVKHHPVESPNITTVKVAPLLKSLKLTQLVPYTNYSVEISTRSITAGEIPWNVLVNFTTDSAAPGSAPVINSAVASSSEDVNITWKKPGEINGPLLGYRISYTAVETRTEKTKEVQGETVAFVLGSLNKWTEYEIRVQVKNDKGYGPYSEEKTVRTKEDVPGSAPVINSAVASSSEDVNITWKKPGEINGPLLGYRISYTAVETRTEKMKEVQGETVAFVLGSLNKWTEYEIRVQVKNDKGYGPYSKEKTVRTKEDVPSSAPDGVTVQPLNAKTYNVSWRPLLGNQSNGLVIAYEVKHGFDQQRRKRRENSNVTHVNTTDEFVLLQNLVPAKGYSASVRAYTKVGPGPYSDPVPMAAPDKEDNSSLSSGLSSAVIPSVAVVGVLLFIILPIVGLIVWKRRRRNSGNQKQASPLNLVSLPIEEPLANSRNSLVREEQQVERETDSMGAEGVYSEANDGDHPRPIPVLSFAEYATRMKKNKSALLRIEYKAFVKVQQQRSWSVGKKPENKTKNRYANIITYDHSRVILEKFYSNDEDDYINASYMPGYDGNPRTYIATQGPTAHTVVDFWDMVWQEKSTSIIMLTNLVEATKVKCAQYWPDDTRTYGTIDVTLQKEEVYPDYILRTLYLNKDGISRHIRQFHFISWPDKGVPQYPTAVLTFRRKVHSWKPADSGPTVVHCSAGVGRTGTYIVIDAMVEQAKKLKTVDIFNYTRVLRDNRPHMVQTDEQYIFIHNAILEALTCGNTEIPAHDLRVIINKLTKAATGTKQNGYNREYKRLNLVSPELSEDESETGRTPENAVKNRFPNSVPLDDSRVILRIGEKQSYINASFVDAYRQRNAFIMTQAPLESTIEDFWRMILQYKIGTIVMLNNLQEREEEFSQYWPSVDAVTYGNITVGAVTTEKRGGTVIRSFKVFEVKRPKHVLMVKQHQHTCWPDKTVPATHEEVLDLMAAVQVSQQHSGNGPVVVHCSDGLGRSGTFCAIYSAVERLKLDQVVDVFQTIKLLRVKRPGAVETLDQYVYCYEALQQYLDSFNAYSNFSDA